MVLRRVKPEEALRLGLLDGKDGVDGIPGEQGIQGPEGPTGRDGLDGKDGVSVVGQPGKDGADGKDGVSGKDAIGEDGEKGDTGEIGPQPMHEWRGEALRFEEAPGEWGKFVNLRGTPGPSGGGSGGGAILPQILKDIIDGTIVVGGTGEDQTSLIYFLGE